MKKWMLLWSIAVFTVVMGQEKQYEVAVVGFYNLENLFDTDSSMQTINVDKLNAGDVDYVSSETYNAEKYYGSDWISLYENVSISKSKTDYSKLPEVSVNALRFSKPNKKDYEERTNQSLTQQAFNELIEQDDRWLSKKELKELIKNNETITVKSKEVIAKINDFENTPLGSRQYTEELYEDKLSKLGEVIASLGENFSPDGAALVGLAEIENQQVLEDLAATKILAKRNYEIIQYDCMYSRGVDVALYYQPKYFEVLESHAIQVPIFNDKNETSRYYTRDILWVEGKLLGEVEGRSLGMVLGKALGDKLCEADGATLGAKEGRELGSKLGLALGVELGSKEGAADGKVLGTSDGEALGSNDGASLGVSDGFALFVMYVMLIKSIADSILVLASPKVPLSLLLFSARSVPKSSS